jgi:hypothetical protein
MMEHMNFPITYTYKMVKGVPLQLDVYVPEEMNLKKGAPAVLLWNHGKE